ncbi:hypothetical protein ID866_8802 [Astraeus odoratus]|nr:hypothetical protein ID866_8802 [Astraeus odoratus]
MKHIASGGFWFDPLEKCWKHAGKDILHYVSTNSHAQHLLNIPNTQPKKTARTITFTYMSKTSNS